MNRTMIRQMQLAVAAFAILSIAGCGVGQAVKSGTVDAAKWAFTTQVKTMNVDFVSRSSSNTNGTGQSLSTVVRIYQLKTPQAFDQLDYVQLQTNDMDALKADLLGSTDLVLRPNANASVSEPMSEDAEYVGIVAFFRDDGRDSKWKLVIPKKQWKKTDPVKVEVRDSSLSVAGIGDRIVKRQTAPQTVNAPQNTSPDAIQPVRPGAPSPAKPKAKETPSHDDWVRAG
ncbi:type VI secretion system lipoprotein TssJ [Caballeronia sordidicola]|uniref:type VI secretion system lipoprotein TssJ n=1 Tax=Caballeronia sordidicola TaxID=196367 RepID=UPI000AF1BC19|nr:type VI secretion system lipoprotein TssJ [Caballeronia sordidicola]